MNINAVKQGSTATVVLSDGTQASGRIVSANLTPCIDSVNGGAAIEYGNQWDLTLLCLVEIKRCNIDVSEAQAKGIDG